MSLARSLTRLKKTLTTVFSLCLVYMLSSRPVLACAVCDNQLGQAIRYEIIHTRFLSFFISIVILFLAFFCLVRFVSHVIPDRTNEPNKKKFLNKHSVPIGGMLIGGAVAGFVDATVFHQLLQTHAMVSDYMPITTVINIKVNMFWDGVFELFTLITLLVGLKYLWHGREERNVSTKLFMGWLFVGFGLFNFLEGLLNHEALTLHHVLQQSAEQWIFYADKLFLLVALILMLIGVALVKRANRSI